MYLKKIIFAAIIFIVAITGLRAGFLSGHSIGREKGYTEGVKKCEQAFEEKQKKKASLVSKHQNQNN